MNIRSFRDADESSVLSLWERCDLLRPWNDPKQDILRKRAVQPEMFLVGLAEGEVVATVMAGYDGHRGWINYLAVDPAQRRKGLGRAMMAEAECRLRRAGCPKINLQMRRTHTSAIEFYQRLRYQVDDVVSLGKRLVQDEET